ncbi:MAG: hypothetical protein ACOYL0_16335, partial [Limnohabitans sp.]
LYLPIKIKTHLISVVIRHPFSDNQSIRSWGIVRNTCVHPFALLGLQKYDSCCNHRYGRLGPKFGQQRSGLKQRHSICSGCHPHANKGG